jgi:ubiquinone/menaquinone biosynthesis C-methylase UbiE
MSESEWGSDVVGLREQIYTLIRFRYDISILDIGCGSGYDLIRLGEQCGENATLVGIDFAPKLIEQARKKTQNDPRYMFFRDDISSGLPFDNECFDLIYSGNVLECITDKDSANLAVEPGCTAFLCPNTIFG